MKKTFLTLAALALSLVSVDAQLTRDGDLQASAAVRQAETPRVLEVPAKLLEKMARTNRTNVAASNAETPFFTAEQSVKTPLSERVRHQSAAKAKAPKAPQMRATLQTSSLEGYIAYSSDYSMPIGWYKGTYPTPTKLWNTPSGVRCSSGFVRDGELFGFYVDNTTDGLIGAGVRIIDVASGSVKSTHAFDIFDNASHAVVNAAYDPTNDVAYVVTYGSTTPTALRLQKFDPKTLEFTDLGVSVNYNTLYPYAMTWNIAENTLYLFGDDKTLYRYDERGKKFNQACTFTYDIDEYSFAITYSPKDDAFVGFVPSYYEDDYTGMFQETTDVVLFNAKGQMNAVSTFTSDFQWSILHCNDTYVAAGAPEAAVIEAVNIEGPALSGSLSVRLPATTNSGAAITGKVYLQVTIDGANTPAVSGAAGSLVEVALNLTEGEHRIALAPYILGDDGKVFGPTTYLNRFFGYETPAAPANVKLTSTLASWDAVTEGVSGGYINPAEVTYNLYIDGELMTPAPIAETSLAITLPENGLVAHRAAVEAIAGGKTSAQGVSAPLYATGALSLPVYLGPEPDETDLAEEVIGMFTVVKDPLNNEPLRGWRYDDQSEHTGGFYCLYPLQSSNGDYADEWLFLPAMKFDDPTAFYRLEMEVWTGGHYFSTNETFEVTIGNRPSAARQTPIHEATTIGKAPNFETHETLFQVESAGTYYIGVHYISPLGKYRLYARNFRVEKVATTAASPDAVTGLRVEDAERGELKALVNFNMPVLNVNGGNLDASDEITAVITTEAGETTVTGKPGQAISTSVAARQGDNTVKVTTSSAAGPGKLAETTVYCGVYAPSEPILDFTVSEDGKTLTLNWFVNEYNDNDQWAGPEQCTYTVYRRVNDNWVAASSTGNTTTYTFTAPTTNQDIYQFAVLASNAAGAAETMPSVGVILGTPYPLPYTETFPVSGNNVDFREPILIEHLSYLPASWGFGDPKDMDPNAGNQSGVALIATWEADTQLTLPKFSSKGMQNVKFTLSTYFGDCTPTMVTILATSATQPLTAVMTLTADDGNGWENKIISLPQWCQDQSWIQITIRVHLDGYAQAFLADSYSLQNFPEDMLTITGFSAPTRFVVGEPSTFSAEITNVGSNNSALPECSLEFIGNGGVSKVEADHADATAIAAGEKHTVKFAYTPKAADLGSALIRLNIGQQPEGAVSEYEHQLTVLDAQLPVVSDLEGSAEGNDVILTWSEPAHTESFEAFEPWDISEEMRGWLNIDRDGAPTYGIGEVSYPNKNMPKGFQVFNSATTSNPLLQSHSGNHCLIAISSTASSAKATDNWLISPEVVGGTQVSFWMNLFSTDYPETMLVMASSTGREPADFTEVAGGYCCPAETGWTKFTVTLPADARYFALWHTGDAGDDLFGFFIDDLSFTPADPAVTMEGYNIYRNGEMLTTVATEGHTDRTDGLYEPIQYAVRTVGTTKAGEKVESARSNVVWVEPSGIDAPVAAEGTRTISAVNGAIILSGFEAGKAVRVFAANGAEILRSATVDAPATSVAASAGIYVVECDGIVAKVSVK